MAAAGQRTERWHNFHPLHMCAPLYGTDKHEDVGFNAVLVHGRISSLLDSLLWALSKHVIDKCLKLPVSP